MPKPLGGKLNDEAVHLYQRGFYVKRLTYPLDPDATPSNGHEYIHQVRLERLALFPEMKTEFSECIPMFAMKEWETNSQKDGAGEVKKVSLSAWRRKEARYFSDLAIEMKLNKDGLMKKFPRKQLPAVENEKEVCLFCLGSELYKKIFEDTDVEDANENLPFLRIVLHIKQEDIFTILVYLNNWFKKIGMNHAIGRWCYGLLACLRKPVSDECQQFLEDFYDECVRKIKTCEVEEKKQLHLLSAILSYYFCVKAYKVGPSLDKFSTFR